MVGKLQDTFTIAYSLTQNVKIIKLSIFCEAKVKEKNKRNYELQQLSQIKKKKYVSRHKHEHKHIRPSIYNNSPRHIYSNTFFYPFLAACSPLNKKTPYLFSVAVHSFLIMFTFNSYNSNFLLFFLARSFAHKRNICLPCVILFYIFLISIIYLIFFAVFVMSDINRFSMVTLHFSFTNCQTFSAHYFIILLDAKHNSLRIWCVIKNIKSLNKWMKYLFRFNQIQFIYFSSHWL